MRVIDLLNKIANGEEVPKEIKWGVHNLTWYVNEYVALDELGKPSFFEIIPHPTRDFLNDEVEIIEEDKKIRKIYTFPGLDDDDYAYEDGNRPNNVKINNKMEKLLINKINEIIDYLEEKEWK